MEKRITQVFYGNDLLPYKDSERSVHYPLVSGTFAGSHNTKQIRFYVRDIGGTDNITWVVLSKLPNGKLGYEICSNVAYDSELGEYYLIFDLSAYYTSVKGDLYLSLRGYEGEVEFEDNDSDGVYNIVGDPLIEVTGTIKLSINYSPMVNTGTQVLPTDIDKIILALNNYIPKGMGIVVIQNTSADISGYENGQMFYVKSAKQFYQLSSGNLVKVDIGLPFEFGGGQTAEELYQKYGAKVFTMQYFADFLICAITYNYLNYLYEFNVYKFVVMAGEENISVVHFGTNTGTDTFAYLYNNATNIKTYTTKEYVDTFGKTIELSLNNTTYVLTATLKDANGNTLATQNVDLPLESTVVSGSYDNDTKSLILVLTSGQTITIPISDLISGLVSTDDLETTLQDYATIVYVNEELDKKANVDGNYPTLTSGLADNLTPYSEDSGAKQDNPFISNGTGTNNNTEIVTVGDYGLLKEKQGSVYCVNQIAINGNFASTSGWSGVGASLSVSSNVATLTANISQSYSRLYRNNATKTIVGRKYLITYNVKVSNATALSHASFQCGGVSTSNAMSGATINTWFTFRKIITATSATGTIQVSFENSGIEESYTFDVKNINVIDIYQWFNGNIPQDLLDHPEHWSWYQNKGDYIQYNTGSLENANGVKLVSTGRNLWDGTRLNTGYYLSSLGALTSSANFDVSDFILIPPNVSLYLYGANPTSAGSPSICFYDKNKNFISGTSYNGASTLNVVSPSNTTYCKISVGKTSSITTLSLYYTPQQGGEGYDKYYPYEQPYIVDTGSEVLRKAGSVKDYKEPNGTIHRLVGTRAYQSGDENDSSLITDGTTTNYPLETPTTEQGTPFAENLPINDYGMLYWLDENDNLVGIPQGAKIFFPTNYKGFVDDMYSRVDGDSSDYALNSELNAKFETYLKSLSGYDATKTQTLKNVNGTFTWVDDE